MARTLGVFGILAFLAWGTGCREAGDRIEAVEVLPAAAPLEQPAQAEAEPTRRGGEGPESILEFGLFGPAVSALDAEISESDCNFENDPYETCL